MKKSTNEVAVGIFVIVGFIFLTGILFFISGAYLFRSGYSVNVLYEYVSILNKGAPVRMAGVKVGEISDVNLYFDKTQEKTRVRIKLFIEKGVEIRENYKFTIRGTHILSEPHIEITPEPGNSAVLQPDSTVEGVDLVPVEALIDRAHDILKNFDSASGSESALSKSMSNIESSSAVLKDILERVQNGEGTVGKLFMSDGLYQEMEALMKDVRAHPWKLVRKDTSSKRKWYFLYLF